MFTPPPSPQPTPGATLPFPPSSKSSSESSPPPTATSREDAKRRTARRFRSAVVLVPIVLIAITAAARILSSESLNISQSWSNLFSKMTAEKSSAWSIVEKRDSNSQLPSIASTSTIIPAPAASNQAVPTVPSIVPTLPTPFPQAFDGMISVNFSTVSCMNFLTNMTNDLSFRSCRPFSMLLQTSNTFISAQGNLTLLNTLIWGTCNTMTTEDQCITNMASYTASLRTQCAQDLKDDNAMAIQTLQGLTAYGVMRDAACLTDPTTNTYCFVSAAHDTNPANLYYYSLPVGLNVPGTASPGCTACLKSLMSLYSSSLLSASKDSLQGLQATYQSAAQLTLGKCGAGFAQIRVASAASGLLGASWERQLPLLAIVSAVLGWWTLVGCSIF